MAPLPLLKLPLLVQKAIIHQWDLNTLFSISILSERTKNHLKECNLKVDKFSLSIHEAFFADLSSIHLESLKDSLIISLLDGSYLRVGNLVMNKNLKPTSTRGYERQSVESLMKLLEKPTQHLLSFLKVRKFELRFGGDIDLINFFLWKYAAKFDSIIIGRNSCAQPAYLTLDELKFILEDVTIDYLELNVAIKEHPNFKYPTTTTHQKPLKIGRIKIHNQAWIDFDKLVLMDFVSIHSNFRSGTAQQMNSLLKSWMSGTNEKLEEFKLNTYKSLFRQPHLIFAGIKATPTVFTDRELRNRYSNVEGVIKMDIKREHDGRQATVILYGKHFVILVWNETQLKEKFCCTMSPLPLLKLPLLVQKAIVYQWDLNTVFCFSILSEKTKNQLQHCNLKVDKFSLLIHDDPFADLSSIHLESRQDSLDIDIANGSHLLVGNLLRDENFQPTSHWGVKCESQSVESTMKLLEKLTQHLLSFLKVRKFELQFGDDVGLINFFFWKYTSKFDSITIGINNFQPIYLTPNELRFILEDVTTDYLELNVAIKKHSEFNYPTITTNQKPLKVRQIKIHDNHDWIDFDKLVLMDFVSIDASFVFGSVQQWNSILKSWMSGPNEILEELKLHAYLSLEGQRDLIFEGIEATATVFTDEELGNRYAKLEGAIKMDIRRSHNGRQATVILYGFNFVMLVWNEEHLKAIGRL